MSRDGDFYQPFLTFSNWINDSADSKCRLSAPMATQGNPAFRVDDRELRRGGTSFTVDTLREIKAELPEAELVFLMGQIH